MPASRSSVQGSRQGSTTNTPSGATARPRPGHAPVSPLQAPPMQSVESSMASVTISSDAPQLPKPSGPGKAGEKVRVLTNQFLFNPTKLPKFVYRWNVDIKKKSALDQTVPSRTKRRCLQLFIEQGHPMSKVLIFTDYEKTLWSFDALTTGPNVADYVEVDLYEVEEQGPRQGGDKLVYMIKISAAAAPLPTAPIQALVTDFSSKTVITHTQEYEDILNNIILRFAGQHSALTTAARGTKVFPLSDFPSNPVAKRQILGGGLVAIRGYIRKARILQGGSFLNLNTTCGAFYMEGLASKLIDIWQQANGKNLGDAKTFSSLEDFLRGVKVMNILGDRPRVKRVIGLSPKPVSQTMFFCDKHPRSEQPLNQNVSCAWWFVEAYGPKAKVSDSDVVLDVGTSAKPGVPAKHVYWPASLMQVLPGQSYKGFLPLPAQTDGMIRHACKRPPDNQSLIMSEGMEMMGISKQSNSNIGHVGGAGLMLRMEMTQVNARRLATPALIFKNKTINARETSRGQFNISGCIFKSPPKSDRTPFAVITLKRANENDIHNFRPFVSAIQADISKRCGFRAQAINVLDGEQVVNWPNNEDPVAYLKRLFNHCWQKGVRYCFIVMSNYRQWYYPLKEAANAAGMQTTITLRKGNAARDGSQDVANLLLKYCTKNGGVNYAIGPNDFEKIAGSNTMLLGLDVVHPTPGALDGAPSIAGLVHSMTPSPGEWLPVVQTQVPAEGKRSVEIFDRIDAMVATAFKRWKNRNGKLPDAIVFTRDGVSDEQLTQVLHTELPSIRRAARQVYEGAPLPKILMVCTQKRHPVRFYQGDKSSAFDDKGPNPLPGLIVDQTIVSRDRNDWYCTAHKCLQGTSKPCRHTVIIDEIGLTKDQQQHLLLNLSFVYQRSVTSVSLPSPARLADVLCNAAKNLAHAVYVPSPEQKARKERYDVNKHFRGQDSIHPNLRDTAWFM